MKIIGKYKLILQFGPEELTSTITMGDKTFFMILCDWENNKELNLIFEVKPEFLGTDVSIHKAMRESPFFSIFNENKWDIIDVDDIFELDLEPLSADDLLPERWPHESLTVSEFLEP